MAATTIARATLTDSVSPTTGDIWNAALIGTALYDAIDGLLTGSTLRQERSSSGQVSFTVASASNTSGSDALLQAIVAGTSGGDPAVVLQVTSGSTWSIGADNSDSDRLKITASATVGANTFVFSTLGAFFLGDNSNANTTVGITINQGANDDEVLAFKSSDVGHGITSFAETDTYGHVLKLVAASGGLLVRGYTSGTTGIYLNAIHTTDDTAKTTAAAGAFIYGGALKSGTGVADLGANANIVAFRNNATTRFILDGDGDSHQDIGTAWTNFHGHDDIELLNTLSAHLTSKNDPLRAHFAQWLEASRAPLEHMRLVTFNENGHHFVNWSRMHMLKVGAILQLDARLKAMETTRIPLWRRLFGIKTARSR